MASKAASNAVRKRSFNGSRAAGAEVVPELAPGRPGTLALLALISALQIWGIAHYFPPANWLGPEPFYANSYALHYARGLRQAESIRVHARFWSYSPALMAGYPAGTYTEPMGAAVGPWLVLTGWINPAVAYKLLVLGSFAAAPFAIAIAARWLELGTNVCLIAALIGAMGIFTAPGIAMIRAGMFLFLAACYVCLALCAFIYRCAQRGGTARFVALAIGGGVLTYLHSLTPLLLAGPGVGVLLGTVRQPRRMAAFVASFAAIFLIALGWFGPIAVTSDLGVHFSNWWTTPTAFLPAARELLSARLNLPPLIFLGLMLYGVATVGLSRWCKASLCVSALIFWTLAYFGSMIPKADVIEPARFELAFYFYAAPFVAAGAYSLWHRFGTLPRWLGYAGRSLAMVTILFYGWISLSLVDLDLTAHGPLLEKLPDQAKELARWIAGSDPDSRLILENGWTMTSQQLLLPYFGADLSLLWALENGRDLIGGSPSEGFSIYRFADLGNGKAFGKSLDDWSAADFVKQLEIYNIGGAILWSPQAKQFFAGLGDVHLLEESAPFALYGVGGTRTFLLEGRAASVRAHEDCIQLKEAQPGRLVLKYHYFRTLRAAPPLPLQTAALDNGDPVPFIGIVNDAPRDITVYNAGFLGLDRPACGSTSTRPRRVASSSRTVNASVAARSQFGNAAVRRSPRGGRRRDRD